MLLGSAQTSHEYGAMARNSLHKTNKSARAFFRGCLTTVIVHLYIVAICSAFIVGCICCGCDSRTMMVLTAKSESHDEHHCGLSHIPPTLFHNACLQEATELPLSGNDEEHHCVGAVSTSHVISRTDCSSVRPYSDQINGSSSVENAASRSVFCRRTLRQWNALARFTHVLSKTNILLI